MKRLEEDLETEVKETEIPAEQKSRLRRAFDYSLNKVKQAIDYVLPEIEFVQRSRQRNVGFCDADYLHHGDVSHAVLSYGLLSFVTATIIHCGVEEPQALWGIIPYAVIRGHAVTSSLIHAEQTEIRTMNSVGYIPNRYR